MINLNNLIELASSPKEPSWRDLFTKVKALKGKERRQFYRMVFLPWPDMSENISMWISLVTYFVAYCILLWFTGVALQGSGIDYSSVIMGGILYILFESYTRLFSRRLAAGAAAYKLKVVHDTVAEIQLMVDSYGTNLITRLKTASGREHIDDNPISMAAATLEVRDKIPKRVNPLQAALNDDLHPNDLIGDSPDEPTV